MSASKTKLVGDIEMRAISASAPASLNNNSSSSAAEDELNALLERRCKNCGQSYTNASRMFRFIFVLTSHRFLENL
jgi:hypothetical protein